MIRTAEEILSAHEKDASFLVCLDSQMGNLRGEATQPSPEDILIAHENAEEVSEQDKFKKTARCLRKKMEIGLTDIAEGYKRDMTEFRERASGALS